MTRHYARILLAGCAAVFAATVGTVVDGTGATAKNGLVRFSYTDSTGTLKLLTTGGNLHFYRVMGCAGLLNSGDRATLGATFTLSPAQTITSP